MASFFVDAARVAKIRGKPLAEAIANWDRSADAEVLAEALRLRNHVLELFPVEAWPSLPKERYALGTDVDESFCKLMEFRTDILGGIGGGSALKHMLYRRADGSWYHRPEYANENEAWEAIRAGFVEAFELGDAAQWAEIDQIPSIKPGSSLRGKAMYVYFVDELLPFFGPLWQEHFYSLLGGEGAAPEGVAASRALFELAQATGLFNGWHTVEIGRFLGAWSDPRVGKRIMKIAPGHNAAFWEECRAGGYVCVGWDEVGDLKQFESKEQFRQAFADVYPDYSPSKASAKANEVWRLMELLPGDFVVANQGIDRIVGIGQVVEPGYVWRPDRGRWAFHTVAVDWEDRPAWDIDPIPKWAMTTVSEVSAEEYKRIREGKHGPIGGSKPPQPPTDVPPDPLLAEIAETIERKGQVILYGPPGTGKTYNARRFSVWWLSRRAGLPETVTLLGDSAAFRKAEEELSSGRSGDGVGQLTRITFHPSYAYEDFVEGYRPQPTGTGQLDLRMTDGIFKRVCRGALADPDRPYLLLVDEINRGNIPKIFGELITLLEKDKRGLTVVLPQSRETFSVPPNVYMLGTMNTADRSIKLLDVALRRRFAFIELMPDPAPLAGGKVGSLDLSQFLTGLNSRIASIEGREKQIGHSFLLEDGQPVATPESFARRFRYEILPLLQEYAYDDYAELETYLGSTLVDAKQQTLNADVLTSPQELVDALDVAFQSRDGVSELEAVPPDVAAWENHQEPEPTV